jgi:hypothetical protein
MMLWMAKTTSFEGDLDDQERVRAKLEDVKAELEEQERLREQVEDRIERLERLRDGLEVILGDKQPESARARAERLEMQRKRFEQAKQFNSARAKQFNAALEQARAQAAATIQAQVEDLVNALERPVSAGDLLEYLPAETRRDAVNYALWRAAETKRIRRLSHGTYGSLAVSTASPSEGGERAKKPAQPAK